MAENYSIGQHRLFHRATRFQEGLLVTADVLSPLLVWEEGVELTESDKGLYYIDFNFTMVGAYVFVIYEEGKKVVTQNFHIIAIANIGSTIGNLTFGGSKGPQVINQ